MAIPFAFPSEDDTDANYQRLDQLLSDLYVVLQQILVTQRRIRDSQPQQIAQRFRSGQASNSRRSGEAPDTSSIPSPLFPPPEPPRPSRMLDTDFASSSSTSTSSDHDHTDLFRLGSAIVGASANANETEERSPMRRRRRRHRLSSESSFCDETKNSAEVSPTVTTPDWTQVGVNLRKIADDFNASVGKDDSQVQVQVVSEEGKRPCDPADASLLSMLVPPPFGGSIWTAVLFVVGWRLLARAR